MARIENDDRMGIVMVFASQITRKILVKKDCIY